MSDLERMQQRMHEQSGIRLSSAPASTKTQQVWLGSVVPNLGRCQVAG
ncbi:hypothetical protein [Pseudomonas sp.]|nr:hypothetical protein [Pseudomonas sp.]MDX1367546.1 hypothetical protein [Pseudomonas sp.]